MYSQSNNYPQYQQESQQNAHHSEAPQNNYAHSFSPYSGLQADFTPFSNKQSSNLNSPQSPQFENADPSYNDSKYERAYH